STRGWVVCGDVLGRKLSVSAPAQLRCGGEAPHPAKICIEIAGSLVVLAMKHHDTLQVVVGRSKRRRQSLRASGEMPSALCGGGLLRWRCHGKGVHGGCLRL